MHAGILFGNELVYSLYKVYGEIVESASVSIYRELFSQFTPFSAANSKANREL
jgi:hypothetical protein